MKLDLLLNGLGPMLDEGERLSVPLRFTRAAQQLYAAAAATGLALRILPSSSRSSNACQG
jgi:3-hydroxyisobutyrate dehydrogenase-like beta-hydroxyacid dehydrogenase